MTVLLEETLEVAAPVAGCKIMRFLHSNWQDLIIVASASKSLLHALQTYVAEATQDVSFGVSLAHISCDPCSECGYVADDCPTHPVARNPSIHVGGPAPRTFRYLNEAVFPMGIPEDTWSDLLEGCECDGGCCGGNEGLWPSTDEEHPSCSCVRLNIAAQSGPAPLFECHAECSCNTACSLRTTQPGGGRQPPPIRLRYMGRKGWGAYSTEPLAAGVYVADYTGEVLPVAEAQRRVPAYDKAGVNYVLTTQEFFQGGEKVWQTIVDATTSGNVSRFFNHSCEPTLSVFVIRRGSFAPRLAFFTRDHVPAGCELTYDYGAVGAAGGNREGLCSSEQNNTPEQPVRKALRHNGKKAVAESTASERTVLSQASVAPSRTASTTTADGEESDRHNQSSKENLEGETKGSPSRSHVSVRRPCLCDAESANDDPYNFDISDLKKKRDNSRKAGTSKLRGGGGQFTLGKTAGSSLNNDDDGRMSSGKTFGSGGSGRRTPSSFSSNAADSAVSLKATAVQNNPLRSSAPAAAMRASPALDKAMGFLIKYKQGNTTPPTTAPTPMSAFRRDSRDSGVVGRGEARKYGGGGHDDDEFNDIDISLSSDDDNTTFRRSRTATLLGYCSRPEGKLRADLNKMGDRLQSSMILRPQGKELNSDSTAAVGDKEENVAGTGLLTGVRSSVRFPTAKELGILGNEDDSEEQIFGPKDAVSPVESRQSAGWSLPGAASGDKYSGTVYPPAPEAPRTSSGLRLSVSIPVSPNPGAFEKEGKDDKSNDDRHLRNGNDDRIREVGSDSSSQSRVVSVESNISQSPNVPQNPPQVTSEERYDFHDRSRRRSQLHDSHLGGGRDASAEGRQSLTSPALVVWAGNEGVRPAAVGRLSRTEIAQEEIGTRESSLASRAQSSSNGAMGNIVSFKDLAAVTGQGLGQSGRSLTAAGGDKDEDLIKYETKGSIRTGCVGNVEDAAEEGNSDDDDDEYGDDDFEELESTVESTYDVHQESTSAKNSIDDSTTELQRKLGNVSDSEGCHIGDASDSTPPLVAPATSSTAERTQTVKSLPNRGVKGMEVGDTDQQHNPTNQTLSSPTRRQLYDGNAVSAIDKCEDESSRLSTREAWTEPAIAESPTRNLRLSRQSDRGTGPAQREPSFPTSSSYAEVHEANGCSNIYSNLQSNENARRESWSSSRFIKAKRRDGYHDTLNYDPGERALADKAFDDESHGNHGDETRGVQDDPGAHQSSRVLIDRSCEVKGLDRPPSASKVKIIHRTETVAAVEYSHDPESGVDLRSLGTQATRSGAAVQVNISVPGMIGTSSALDARMVEGRREGLTVGVGYRPGEPYSKWGRFTCDFPAHQHPIDQQHLAEREATRAATMAATSRRRRSWSKMGAAGGSADSKVEDDVLPDKGGERREGAREGGLTPPAVLDAEAGETTGRDCEENTTEHCNLRSFSGDGPPAYLQVFLRAMADLQAESRAAWQTVIEETARMPGSTVARAQPACGHTENGTDDSAHHTEEKNETLFRVGSGMNLDVLDATIATQEAFRKQLTDIRESLNRIRYRAEATGGRGRSAYSYVSTANTRELLDNIRPAPTTQEAALIRIDPSLTPQQAASTVEQANVKGNSTREQLLQPDDVDRVTDDR